MDDLKFSSVAEYSSSLFNPLWIGRIELQHRIVMSALTRGRCPAGIPTSLSVEYYSQRATDGGLIVSEGMHPSLMAGNYHNVPSMYAPEHIRAWKKITDAVHLKGGYMFCQLWHTGRVTVSANLGGRKPLGPSPIKLEDYVQRFTPVGPVPSEEPAEMTQEEIQHTISDHVHAAKCAIQAGFDGIEIQGANGYLLDQFLCANVNNRTDSYGGSVANRARLTLEILHAISSAVGAHQTGIRFSPFGIFQNPLGHHNPVGDFTWLLQQIDKLGLAYVCIIQPGADLFISSTERLALQYEAARARGVSESQLEDEVSLRSFRKVLKQTTLLSNGGFDDSNCVEPVENGKVDGIVFGRHFISNPDLVRRLRNGWPLASWDRKTFYTQGLEGLTDYSTWSDEVLRGDPSLKQRL